MKKFALAACSVALLGVIPAVAGAATVALDTQNHTKPARMQKYYDADGQNGWVENVVINWEKGTFNTFAGMFRLTADVAGTKQNILAWCTELDTRLNLPRVYSYGADMSSSVRKNLDTLFANAKTLVTNKTTAAAYQLSVWEMLYDTDYSLDTGAFTAAATKNAGVAALANTWLSNIANSVWAYDADNRATYLKAGGSQDVQTDLPAPVPVPAAGLMLMGGLAGLGALRRRSAAKA